MDPAKGDLLAEGDNISLQYSLSSLYFVWDRMHFEVVFTILLCLDYQKRTHAYPESNLPFGAMEAHGLDEEGFCGIMLRL